MHLNKKQRIVGKIEKSNSNFFPKTIAFLKLTFFSWVGIATSCQKRNTFRQPSL